MPTTIELKPLREMPQTRAAQENLNTLAGKLGAIETEMRRRALPDADPITRAENAVRLLTLTVEQREATLAVEQARPGLEAAKEADRAELHRRFVPLRRQVAPEVLDEVEAPEIESLFFDHSLIAQRNRVVMFTGHGAMEGQFGFEVLLQTAAADQFEK